MAKELDTIETVRLLLRGIDLTDSEMIVKWRSIPDFFRYFKSPHQITIDEHLNWYRSSYLENYNRFEWICIEKESGDRVGVFGLEKKEEEKVEISYLLAPEKQHKGFAIEAVKSLLEYATKRWDCKRVIAYIHQDNQPSIELVLKLGFRVVARDDPFVVYAIEV